MSGDISLEEIDRLLEGHRYAEAHGLVSRALAARPADPGLHVCLALVLDGVGERPAALTAVERAVALAPEDAAVHRERARLLSRSSHHTPAYLAALQAVRLAPLDWTTHLVLAEVCVEQARTRRVALDASLVALDLAPHEPDAHAMHGFVLLRRRRRAAARDAFGRALRLDPFHAPAQLGLGAAGRGLRPAGRALASALRTDPLDPDLHEAFGLGIWTTVTGLWCALILLSPRALGAAHSDSLPQVALVIGLLTAVVGLLLVRTPRRLWRPCRHHVRRDPALLVLTGLVLVGVLNLAIAPTLPRSAALLQGMVYGAVVVIGVPAYLVGRHGRRRAGLPT